MSPKEFLENYYKLCHESGFCLVADDHYETIVLSRLNPISSNMDEVMDDFWISCILSCFDYE